MRNLSVQTSPPGKPPIFRAWQWPPVAFLLLWVLGCGEQTQIEEYELPKGSINIPPPTESVAETPKVPTRMLAAMIPQGKKSWFFKVVGPDELVTQQVEDVVRLITTVNFSNSNTPQWKLPEGWTQEGSDGRMRFATIKIPTEPALEMSVMSLPTQEGDYDEYTLINVNRWRDQVHLPRITKEELAHEVTEVPTEDGKALMVNLKGWQQGNEGMQPPFAGGAPFAGGQRPVPTPPRTAPAAQGLPSHDVPQEWTKVANKNSLTLETYQVAKDGKQAEVTMIRMALLPDDLLLPNINRWRGQVGMEPIKQAEVKDAVTEIQAGNLTGRYLKLDGPQKAMLVAMLDQAGSTWYIKMLGDSPLVLEKEAQFKKFVQSVRFSPNEEAGE